MMKRKKPLKTNAVESVPEKTICESCGAAFFCGANAGKCWCFAVEVKRETLTELRESYKSCLCEKCLNKIGNYGEKEK